MDTMKKAEKKDKKAQAKADKKARKKGMPTAAERAEQQEARPPLSTPRLLDNAPRPPINNNNNDR